MFTFLFDNFKTNITIKSLITTKDKKMNMATLLITQGNEINI